MNIPAGTAPYLEAILTFPRDGRDHSVSVTSNVRNASQESILAAFRSRTVSAGTEALDLGIRRDFENASKVLNALSKDLTELSEAVPDNEGIKALNGDVSGRMLKSIDGSQRFNRWGNHYLRSLMRAHQLMQ